MDTRPGTPRKPATLRDVARESGVSIAAASYSLNGGGTIGDEVRARVRDVANRLGYRPNKSAQAVRTGKATTIGLIVPDLTNPYYPAIAQSVDRAARRAGYTVILIDCGGVPESEVEAMRQLETHGVAGAVWCQTAFDQAGEAGDYQVPVTVLGTPTDTFDCVTADDTMGGRLAAEHLIGLGHRRIGLLSGPIELRHDERRRSFMAAYEGCGKIVWQCATRFDTDLGGEVDALLARREATAVMCGNDLIAVGALRAARRAGVRIPDELSVVGFDDIPWASVVTPPLTTIRQPVGDMASAAVEILIERIGAPERPVQHRPLTVSLVVRDSTRQVDLAQATVSAR